MALGASENVKFNTLNQIYVLAHVKLVSHNNIQGVNLILTENP